MSAIATGREARWPGPPSWLRCAGAVVGGTLLAWVSLIVVLLPFAELGLVPVSVDDTSGQGWPWRIDGAWSLVADIGPLLFCGAVLAWGVEGYTSRWTGIRGRRLPVALVAAAVGWIPLNGSHQGVLAVGGLTAFLAVVWVVRQYSVVERGRIAWTRGRVALVAGGVVALVAISLSYGVLHPLTAGNSGSAGPNKTGVWLHNEGRLPVRVLAISAPGPRVVRARLEAGGATIARGDSRLAYVARPCGSFDRLIILVRVAGRDVEQTVHVAQPSELSC